MNDYLKIVERFIDLLFKSEIKELMIDGISNNPNNSPTTLKEFFDDFVGEGRFNFYPSEGTGPCCSAAIFMSLSKKPKQLPKLKRSQLVPLDKTLHSLVQHMQGSCQKKTKYAIIITDTVNSEVFDPWLNNINNMQILDGAQIQVIRIMPDGELVYANLPLGLPPF